MGHQLIERGHNGRTSKLKFGHRGAKHPVHDPETGGVHVTAQNHSYAIDAESLHGGLEVSHINLNDSAVEGFAIGRYHSCLFNTPQASLGPLDNAYLIERLLQMVERIE